MENSPTKQKTQTIKFVEDWLCYTTSLGEGAYGEVKLLVHSRTGDHIACKIINHDRYKDAATNINREVTIHKLLDHENIIKFFGRRQEPLREYIFLEYAAGGELFQMIEPDKGMPFEDARRYMKELLCGVRYLHDKGVTHRDIKPENLLIDKNGGLKISDFGMATLFRLKGKERLMDKKCGTKPYLAPEVLVGKYRAPPADLWSCGIVFVAMLTGELPWAEPHALNEEFVKWKNDGYIVESPWTKLSNIALGLAKHMLSIDPSKRFTIDQIENHAWMRLSFGKDTSSDETDSSVLTSAKRWNSMIEEECRHNREIPDVALSQPIMAYRPPSIDKLVLEVKPRRDKCFSQPNRNEDLMIQFTPSPITKENFHHLIKRMTRFYVNTSHEKTLEVLCSLLDTYHYTWNVDASGAVTISTVDVMKNQLVFKAVVLDMDGKILLDFRLSKGCGIEFKKKFLKLRNSLSDIIDSKE